MTELTPERSGELSLGGRAIHWEYLGGGDREVACLLNGLAMSTRSWYGLLPLLSDQLDVLLWDYPGQGESSTDDVPVLMPEIAGYLEGILDQLDLGRVHLMGISYGGFVALEFARLHQERLHTLTLSGTLLSHERLFEMYEELSLRFYRGDEAAFDLYTHYMYEKIFSESFVRTLTPEQLDVMRQRFFDRYAHQTHCLIRLTEAQDPFFAALDDNLPGYRAIRTPTLVLAGDQDRAIPPWVQRKVTGILPHTRFELVPDCGHVVYLERAQEFFGMLKRFAAAKTLEFEAQNRC